MSDSLLDALISKITELPPAQQEQIVAEAATATKHMLFVPNPGPQTEAYLSQADVLLFGGSPGGGKTALEVGLALNEHHRSLIVRREFVDLTGVLHTLDNIVGRANAATGGNRPVYRKDNDGIIEFMGVGDDIGKFQGNPHDLICVDEAAQIPEVFVRMLIGWLRTDRPGQRTRVVLGSNPPLDSVGDWMVEFFAPWLDPKHPNPAAEGELRYFLPKGPQGQDIEVEAGETMLLNGVVVPAQSRTFISSKFTDNPFYSKEDYAKSLAALPTEMREALMTGNFLTNRSDDVWQLIPTDWVREAQRRWINKPPIGVPMCAMGVDVAQGGADNTVLAVRHDGWYAPLVVIPGKETPDGPSVAAQVVKHRRDNAMVTVDLGGGWGGECYGHLRANSVECTGYLGVKASTKRTQDGKLKFTNERTAAYWRLREALDPSQEGGSQIALPPDSVLLADLCAVRYQIGPNGIAAESKEKVVERLGRSPDRGDAVVMAWVNGLKQEQIEGGWTGRARKRRPSVVTGYQNVRRM